MKRRILSVFLLLSMMASLLVGFSLTADAAVVSGKALDEDYIMGRVDEDDTDSSLEDSGDNTDMDIIENIFEVAENYQIQYSLDTETGRMDIYCGQRKDGSTYYQAMLPYARMKWVPWLKSKYKNKIKTVYIHEGVLSVGRYSFAGCTNLEAVYIPHSVEKINRTVFYQCPNLKTIYYAGTEEDFQAKVLYDDVRNEYVDSLGNVEYKALEKIRYGESVTVKCVNQEGEVMTTYTVGGYAAGDTYKITPNEGLYRLDGVEYVGTETEITGTFKKNDKTEIVLKYRCTHEYETPDPSKPCGSYCKNCGRLNPEMENEHNWEVTTTSEQGLFTPLVQDRKCTVCAASEHIEKLPMGVYYGAVLGAGLVVLCVILAIVIPIRKRKKLKEMTW